MGVSVHVVCFLTTAHCYFAVECTLKESSCNVQIKLVSKKWWRFWREKSKKKLGIRLEFRISVNILIFLFVAFVFWSFTFSKKKKFSVTCVFLWFLFGPVCFCVVTKVYIYYCVSFLFIFLKKCFIIFFK